MSEKYGVEDFTFWLGCQKTDDNDQCFLIDAIIVKLRAGEKLKEAAKAHLTFPIAHSRDALRKAIKDYKEA